MCLLGRAIQRASFQTAARSRGNAEALSVWREIRECARYTVRFVFDAAAEQSEGCRRSFQKAAACSARLSGHDHGSGFVPISLSILPCPCPSLILPLLFDLALLIRFNVSWFCRKPIDHCLTLAHRDLNPDNSTSINFRFASIIANESKPLTSESLCCIRPRCIPFRWRPPLLPPSGAAMPSCGSFSLRVLFAAAPNWL